MMVLGAHSHGHSSPDSSPSTIGSARNHPFTLNEVQGVHGSEQQLPDLNSGLAEVRVSTEDMQSQVSGRLSAPVRSGHGSLHNGQMVDILLTDSPR